jgi:hypothetical protein
MSFSRSGLAQAPVAFLRQSQVFGRGAGQAANSINDWYPEKVNQAFSRVV